MYRVISRRSSSGLGQNACILHCDVPSLISALAIRQFGWDGTCAYEMGIKEATHAPFLGAI